MLGVPTSLGHVLLGEWCGREYEALTMKLRGPLPFAAGCSSHLLPLILFVFARSLIRRINLP